MDSIAVKSCTNPECPEENPQPLERFYKKGSGRYSNCKTCTNATTYAYRKANPDRISAINKRCREKGAGRRYYQKNLEENRWQGRIKSAVARGAAYGAAGTFSVADVFAKLELQGSRCYYCETLFEGTAFDIDHKIPFTNGGSNWPANICCACDNCNSRKHNKDFWEFSGKVRHRRST